MAMSSAVARCQILGGHTVNRDVGYGVHSYINLKILGGQVPVCLMLQLCFKGVYVSRATENKGITV